MKVNISNQLDILLDLDFLKVRKTTYILILSKQAAVEAEFRAMFPEILNMEQVQDLLKKNFDEYRQY